MSKVLHLPRQVRVRTESYRHIAEPTDADITEIIYRTCVIGDPPTAVALELGWPFHVVTYWMDKYQVQEGAP